MHNNTFFFLFNIYDMIKDFRRFGHDNDKFALLKEKLLSFGGKIVVEVYEEDIDKLLSRGRLYTQQSKIVKMQSSKCHSNSSIFWRNYTKEHGKESAKIITGWALTEDDQMWRQHTWVLLTKQKLIIETTVKRDKYFGYELNYDETTEFIFNND